MLIIDNTNRLNSSLTEETPTACHRQHVSEFSTSPECKSKCFSGLFYFWGHCWNNTLSTCQQRAVATTPHFQGVLRHCDKDHFNPDKT